MKRKAWGLMLAIALSVCVAVGAAACGEKEKLETPQNVSLSGSTLSWDAVENAEEYTVKIGNDETTVLSTTSLKLTDVKDKLKVGQNALSVRANETDSYIASDYSPKIFYLYEIEDKDKVELGKPMNLRLTGTVLSWDAVINASGYTVKVGSGTLTTETNSIDLASPEAQALLQLGPNAISVYANGAGNYLDSAESKLEGDYIYSKPFDAPTGLTIDGSVLSWTHVTGGETYTVKINDDESTTVSTVTTGGLTQLDLMTVMDLLQKTNTISVKVRENPTIYRLASEYSEPITFEYDEEAVAAAKEFSDMVAQITTLTQDSTQDEAKAAQTAIESAEAKYAALNENALVFAAAAKSSLDAKKTAYETETAAATAAHAAFAEAIEAAEAERDKGESVIALKEKITAAETARSGLSTLASGLVTEEETGRIAALTEAMLKLVFDVKKNEKLLYNSDRPNEAPAFVLVLQYVNIEGDKMQPEKAPTVTIEEQVEGDEKRTIITSDVTYEESYQAYIVIAELTNAFKDKKPITVTYTVNDSMADSPRTETLAFGEYGGIVYFKNGTSEGYINNKLALNGGTADPTIIEAYLTRDIVKGKGNESIEIKGLPFAVGTKDDFENPESLRYFAAKAGITGNVSVSLLAYQQWEENGKIRVSVINSASICAPIDVKNVSEADAKDHLPMPKFQGTTELNIQKDVDDGILATLLGLDSLSRAQASEIFCLHVQVTHNGETKDHYESLSSNYVHSLILEEASMRQLFYDLFQDQSGTGYEATIRLAFVEGSPYAEKFAESYPIYYSYEGSVYGGKFVPDLNGGKWDLGDENGNINYRTNVVSTESAYHDGALIYIFDTDGIDDVQTHVFTAEDAFAVYHIKSASNVSWKKANGNNSALYEVIRAAWVQSLKKAGTSLEEIDYSKTYSFVFAIGLVPNALGEQFHYSASDLVYATKNDAREVKEFTFTEADVKAPDFAQFDFAGSDVEYLRPGEGLCLARGDIFSVGKAAYIELKFEKGQESYSVCLFEENGKVVIYKDKDKTGGNGFSVGDVGNSWSSANDLSNKIKTWYGLDSMDIRDGWSYSTRVHVDDNSAYYTDGEWSEPVEHNLT